MALGGFTNLDSLTITVSPWIQQPTEKVAQTLDPDTGYVPAINDVVMYNATTGKYSLLDADATLTALTMFGVIMDLPDTNRAILARNGQVDPTLLTITDYAGSEDIVTGVLNSGFCKITTN